MPAHGQDPRRERLQRLRVRVRYFLARHAFDGRPSANFRCRTAPSSNEVVCAVRADARITYYAWSGIQLAIADIDRSARVRLMPPEGYFSPRTRGGRPGTHRDGTFHASEIVIDASAVRTVPELAVPKRRRARRAAGGHPA